MLLTQLQVPFCRSQGGHLGGDWHNNIAVL